MKLLTLLCAMFAATLFFSFSRPLESSNAINPLLGDISYVKKYGHKPGASTDEVQRIRAHFEYVENLLRQTDVSTLSPALQQKRVHMLDLLHEYAAAGIFPRNYEHKEKRVPCFIDIDGRICGVGYLVEQTAGRKVAEAINSKFKYAEIMEMNDAGIENWIAGSGLTKEECAMIQPKYGLYNPNYISIEYGISSSLLGGLNLSLNTMNAIQISRGSQKKAVPIISIFTGAGSVILGTVQFNGWTNNESRKAVSMVNIGLGTTTVILGIWNLAANRKIKDKTASWNIYSYPGTGKYPSLALGYARRL